MARLKKKRKKKEERKKESVNYIFPFLPAPSPWQQPFYSPPPHHGIIYNRQGMETDLPIER